MTKYGILILTVLSSLISGQLKLELKLKASIAEITLINTSGEHYVLPLDKKRLRPYESVCNDFTVYESEFPSFGLMTGILNSSDEVQDYIIGYKSFDEINSEERDIEKRRNELKNKIHKWNEKNKIGDGKIAFINYFLVNNLVFIKPYEKIAFKITFDIQNITGQELIFYSYWIKKTDHYRLYLSLCKYDDAEKYLTAAQKKKLGPYKFFNGYLESNSITF